ncbi:MAG TPA: hypothetical protein VJT09_02170 [Pyrinomonadaceae bacterium]|nr:hypothetical protein [Pyrinomonadaceae bacterium]
MEPLDEFEIEAPTPPPPSSVPVQVPKVEVPTPPSSSAVEVPKPPPPSKVEGPKPPPPSYVPVRVPEMTDEDYSVYAESSRDWMDKRAAKSLADLTVGSYLYHGTSEDVARIVVKAGLQPASPLFRKVGKGKAKRWDASRDGFLSMATGLAGVTVTGKSVILRIRIMPGDLEAWQWKNVGGADEVVTTRAIPADRLQWSKNKRVWFPMDQLV